MSDQHPDFRPNPWHPQSQESPSSQPTAPTFATQPTPAQPSSQPTPPPFPQQPYPSEQYPAQPGTPYAMTPYAMAPYTNLHAPNVGAPYGIDPATGIPYSDKSKLVAGLLQIFLGTLGVGRFYLGNVGMGIAQILVTWLTLGFGALWPLIDGIILLAGSPVDRNGRPLRP